MNKKYSVEYQTRKSWTIWIFVALLCALLLNNLAGDYFKKAFVNLTVALTPLIIGIVIAFVLKKLVDILENRVFKKLFSKLKCCNKISRIISIFLLFLLLFLLIFLFLWFVIPEVVDLVNELNANLSTYVSKLKSQLIGFFNQIGISKNVDIEKLITDFINQIGDSLTKNIPLIAESIALLIQQIIVVLTYILTGVVIAFLILYKKEDISIFSKRIVNVSFKKSKAEKIIYTAKMTDKILFDYISVKLIESFIIFLLMLPGFLLFNVPYAVVMAIFFALINIIPYIGSIIGAIPVFLFCVIANNVSLAFGVIIYIIVIVNLYNYFVSPILYGKKLKVSSLLILISLLVFGSIFGFWGLIIGPPLIAVIWIILNEYLEVKEKEKKKFDIYNLSEDDMLDYEILSEAAKLVKKKRETENKKTGN